MELFSLIYASYKTILHSFLKEEILFYFVALKNITFIPQKLTVLSSCMQSHIISVSSKCFSQNFFLRHLLELLNFIWHSFCKWEIMFQESMETLKKKSKS